ncbi:hypothetical protein JCM5353_001613 [Sporobolomyces roseus]
MMPPGWSVAEDTNPPRFSEQDIERFKERRQIAKASPLRKQTLLHFSLPSIYPASTYDPILSFPQSPNPPRQASQSLLTLLSDSSSRPLALKLVKGIQKGSGRWSQVWRAEIEVEGRKRKVVVKLYAESLFPIPLHPVDGIWQSGDELAQKEADAYQAFRATQGRDVPICYGFFNFSTPWNETVKGVILEDLTKIALQLTVFGQNFKYTGNGFEERDSDDELDRKRPSDSDNPFDTRIDDETARSRAKKLKTFVSLPNS